VLASVFTGSGAYSSPQAFVDGLIPAIWVGVGVLAFGALVVLLLPFKNASAEQGNETDQADRPVGADRERELDLEPAASSRERRAADGALAGAALSLRSTASARAPVVVGKDA
jgi:hypothetical protein